VVLEDEGARVALCGAGLPAGGCVTGVVAAVRGRVHASGDFEVVDVCYAGMPPQAPRPPPPPPPPPGGEAGGAYVLLVSGLGLGDEGADPLRLQLLVDYVCGALGGGGEQATAARVARVVVAGGLLKGSPALSQPTAYTGARQQAGALAPLREADMALTELAAAVPVDVMPGAADPANYSLPQQPLHRCLFPGAAAFPTFSRCTSPHAFEAGGVSFLGTSGQNVDDVLRYSELEGGVAALEALLTWRHLVPTAPDTLAAYPYYDDDPFVLGAAPHVLFAGGQPAFGTGVARGAGGQAVRLVAVPDFAATGTAVLVNLATLAVHPIHFGAGLQGL
jgi:DNA polymerase delta subunit 2